MAGLPKLLRKPPSFLTPDFDLVTDALDDTNVSAGRGFHGLSVDREGSIYIDDAQVTLEEFKAAIRDVWTQKGTPAVYVRADENSSYGIVLKVIAALKAAEIEAVGLVAEPEVRRRR